MRIQSLQDLHLSFPGIQGYWNMQDLEQTEKQIRAHFPLDETSANSAQVEAVTQMARLFSLQGQLKEARQCLVYSDLLLKSLDPDDLVRMKTRHYLEEGRFYCLSMIPFRALESFRKAWELSADVSDLDFLAIEAAYMISTTVPAKQGKDWLQRALDRLERSTEESLAHWRPHLYMAMGWQAFDARDFSTALEYFQKAYECVPDQKAPIAVTIKWCKGRCLRAMSDTAEALKIQEEIATMLAEKGDSNGYVLLEMAECFQQLQQAEKARNHFQLAFEKLKLDKWYCDNSDDELRRIQKNFKKY